MWPAGERKGWLWATEGWFLFLPFLYMYQRVTGVYLRPFPLCCCNKTEIKRKTGSTCFFFISAVTFPPEILGYQNERVSHSLPLWVIFRYEGVFKILNVYSLSLYISGKRDFFERISRIFPARTKRGGIFFPPSVFGKKRRSWALNFEGEERRVDFNNMHGA